MKPLATVAAGLLLAMLGCVQDNQSPGDPESPDGSEPALAAAATAALSFYQVSANFGHTCGLTTDNRAYCWGSGAWGQIGDGTTVERHQPAAVAGGLRFSQVSAGWSHTCAVTTEYKAYCWGENEDNELGDGTTTDRLAPVPVSGALRFREVDAGAGHTCGVTYPDNRAYCWGYGGDGQLGDGVRGRRAMPVAVLGALRFRQVRAGMDFTCGLTTENQVYCWGSNRYGQIGDSSTAGTRFTPTLIAGGRQYREVDAGGQHGCAVTTGYKAFCWGNGRDGQLGNGKQYLSFWPRAVAGGLSFERLTAGFYHTCGETTLNRAYCWGRNVQGNLGDGTHLNYRLTPVGVAGGHFFSQLSAGHEYTCGRTDKAVAYCWGYNQYGRLGDGTTTERWTPTAVAGPS
jgi:alpha-tubulin suppressor-like RCC1 family protein